MEEREYVDIMVDLETLGLSKNAPIVSIGAVAFDINTGEILNKFYTRVEWVNDQKDRPLDRDTVKWWLKQSSEAQNELINSEGVLKLKLALKRLDEFFGQFKTPEGNSKPCTIWANGATFDAVILDDAYQNQAKRMPPWGFRNIRDCRTLKDIGETLGMNFYKMFQMTGEAHNALDDCLFQIEWTVAAWQIITGRAILVGLDIEKVEVDTMTREASEEMKKFLEEVKNQNQVEFQNKGLAE